MKKIIFVCTGNTCRSPMAEAILKNKLKLLNNKNFKVISAGIKAETNTKTNPNSIWALKQLGIIARAKKAVQLTKNLVQDNSVIITMTDNHKAYLINLNNVYSLSDFNSGINLPDPFGQDKPVYLNCAKILNFVIDEILEKLINGEL